MRQTAPQFSAGVQQTEVSAQARPTQAIWPMRQVRAMVTTTCRFIARARSKGPWPPSVSDEKTATSWGASLEPRAGREARLAREGEQTAQTVMWAAQRTPLKGGTETQDPMKKFMRQVAGAFADLEKAHLVGRLKAPATASATSGQMRGPQAPRRNPTQSRLDGQAPAPRLAAHGRMSVAA